MGLLHYELADPHPAGADAVDYAPFGERAFWFWIKWIDRICIRDDNANGVYRIIDDILYYRHELRNGADVVADVLIPHAELSRPVAFTARIGYHAFSCIQADSARAAAAAIDRVIAAYERGCDDRPAIAIPHHGRFSRRRFYMNCRIWLACETAGGRPRWRIV